MKVYFIGDKYDSCYYVRCLLPLRENGWDGAKTALWRDYVDNATMLKGAMASDVIVFQRPMDPKKLEAAKLLKLKGKKIVFDNDDTYREDSGTPAVMIYKTKKLVKKINKILYEFASLADLVTVSTPSLAKEYENLNDNVCVLPNCVDEDDWEEPLEKDNKEIRIGLVGSVISTGDFFVIKDDILKLLKRDDIKLVIFGLNKNLDKNSLIYKVYKKELSFWDKIKDKIEWYNAVEIKEYMSFLNELKLDIMLIPRQENYFNMAKSNLKFLEASMVESLTIASSFLNGNSPYEQNKEDKNYLVLVKNNNSWYDVIDYYIRNIKETREIAKRAREYVIQQYNIKTKGHLWEEAYKKIYEGN